MSISTIPSSNKSVCCGPPANSPHLLRQQTPQYHAVHQDQDKEGCGLVARHHRSSVMQPPRTGATSLSRATLVVPWRFPHPTSPLVQTTQGRDLVLGTIMYLPFPPPPGNWSWVPTMVRPNLRRAICMTLPLCCCYCVLIDAPPPDNDCSLAIPLPMTTLESLLLPWMVAVLTVGFHTLRC